MPATFTQRFQVRFDECAPDGTARAGTLLRYVVETAFGHSAQEGFPLGWYAARGLFWLVRRAHLDLPRPIAYGTVLEVTTEVLGFRRIWARRRNTLREAGADNSAAYLDLLDNALVDAGADPQTRPVTIEAEYLRAAVPGEMLHRCVWPDRGGWMMAVDAADGRPVVRTRWLPRP